MKSGWGCLRRRPTPIFGTRSKEANVSNLCVESVNLILLSQVVEMLVAQGFSQWEATEVELFQYAPHLTDCPCPIRLIIPCQKPKKTARKCATPHLKLLINKLTYHIQLYLNMLIHKPTQYHSLTSPTCRLWRRRGRTPRRTCRSRRPAT